MRDSKPYAYLRHMKDSADAVFSYAKNNTFEQFDLSNWDQAAVIRNLEIIGEAANNIPIDFRKEHSNIPWQDIIDFRNVAIHQYMEVDNKIVWDILQNDIPSLIHKLDELLKEFKF